MFSKARDASVTLHAITSQWTAMFPVLPDIHLKKKKKKGHISWLLHIEFHISTHEMWLYVNLQKYTNDLKYIFCW